VRKNSVTSKSVKNGSLKEVDVKKDSLTGATINEAALVPACPTGTAKAGDTCIETTERAAQGLDGAMSTCAAAGRTLPTPAQYRTLHLVAGVSVNGNQTRVYGTTTNALASDTGLAVSNDASFARPFRCAVMPNG
jgi:hypothetical protein